MKRMYIEVIDGKHKGLRGYIESEGDNKKYARCLVYEDSEPKQLNINNNHIQIIKKRGLV